MPQSARLGITTVALLLLASVTVSAQAPPECAEPNTTPVNPTRVCFIASVDHDTLDSYALDIRDDANVLVQTIDMGKPPAPATANGERWVNWASLMVAPYAFGTYTAVARAIAGGITSVDSLASNTWDRGPLEPGAPRVVDHAVSCDTGWQYRASLRAWVCDLADN